MNTDYIEPAPLFSERVRVSIPTALREAGVSFVPVVDETAALRYEIAGEILTPGEACDRYLRPRKGDAAAFGWVGR